MSISYEEMTVVDCPKSVYQSVTTQRCQADWRLWAFPLRRKPQDTTESPRKRDFNGGVLLLNINHHTNISDRFAMWHMPRMALTFSNIEGNNKSVRIKAALDELSLLGTLVPNTTLAKNNWLDYVETGPSGIGRPSNISHLIDAWQIDLCS